LKRRRKQKNRQELEFKRKQNKTKKMATRTTLAPVSNNTMRNSFNGKRFSMAPVPGRMSMQIPKPSQPSRMSMVVQPSYVVFSSTFYIPVYNFLSFNGWRDEQQFFEAVSFE